MQNLAVNLETEGRYLFLNCIANQLRYLNLHTHYFSCTLLYLFAEANTEAIQEQVCQSVTLSNENSIDHVLFNPCNPPWNMAWVDLDFNVHPSFQITRVLLERLIVNRPHPWGLLITFIELIKNPSFKFWQHEFVTCAPEIQKLFESVARSCMVPPQPGQQQVNYMSAFCSISRLITGSFKCPETWVLLTLKIFVTLFADGNLAFCQKWLVS